MKEIYNTIYFYKYIIYFRFFILIWYDELHRLTLVHAFLYAFLISYLISFNNMSILEKCSLSKRYKDSFVCGAVFNNSFFGGLGQQLPHVPVKKLYCLLWVHIRHLLRCFCPKTSRFFFTHNMKNIIIQNCLVVLNCAISIFLSLWDAQRLVKNPYRMSCLQIAK